MKKLLYIFLFVPLALFGQDNYFDDAQAPLDIRPELISDSLKNYYATLEKEFSLELQQLRTAKTKSLSNRSLSRALTKVEIPYPILFVHGLVGSSQTWLQMIEWLEPSLGESVNLDFSLNSDGRLSSSDMEYDVQSLIPSSLTSTNLYNINFNCNSSGYCYLDGSEVSNYSNQAAITKQGKAIGIAVASILEATGKSKVILIGHSMGGLAIREYLQNDIHWLKNSHSVAKLITVGTPHCGSDIEFLADFFLSDLGTALNLTDIRATSEAVRDLRSSYDLFLGIGRTDGTFIWGGTESQNYMNDNLISSWDNVDVNCNGVVKESVIGINQRSIYNLVEYASIRDPQDEVVTPDNANVNWQDEETGGEDICSVLSHWNGSEERHCENWNVDAQGSGGGHSALPEYEIENLWTLDEPDGEDLSVEMNFRRAYEINLDTEYAGFITPQGDNISQEIDIDNFKVHIKSDGVLNISAKFLDGSAGDDIYLYEKSTESYINSINNVTNDELMSTNVSEGWYAIQFWGNESKQSGFSQYFFSADMDYNDVSISEIQEDEPKVIKMVDVLGREQNAHDKGVLLFYIYDNGSVEKRVFH